MAKYTRAFSIDHRNRIVLDSSDPRATKLNQYKSKLGRKTKIKSFPEQAKLKRNE